MASPRRAVIEAFDRLAFSAELLDDGRARAYGAASWAVRKLEGDLVELHAQDTLRGVSGLGPAALEVIDEVLAGERPRRLVELEAKVPEGLFAIRQIKGLGPKKVKALWQGLGITTLGELEYACTENRLVTLDGFGPKTQGTVLAEIGRVRASEGLHRRDHAEAILGPIATALARLEGVTRVEVVGEHARGHELVRSLELLVCTTRVDGLREAFEAARPPEVPVLLHVTTPEALTAARVFWTSSDGHREALAARAAARGLRFDEHGLRLDEHGLHDRPACADVAALYAALGLALTATERREDGVPLVELGRATPRLLERKDLRGALHNHTTASDGSATLREMRAAAAAAGLAYLGISEHSGSAAYAGGLDGARLLAQLAEIQALAVDNESCVLLTGVESDILEHGELDYDDALLARLDVVVASVHRRHGQGRDAMTARLVTAVRSGRADVIGHPTGRLLLGRAPSELDMEAFLDACREERVAVELNANPARLDLSATYLAMAKERGVLVSISADAHSTGELAHLAHGVAVARRAGLTAEDVLNARTREELSEWVQARRAR